VGVCGWESAHVLAAPGWVKERRSLVQE